MTSPGSSPLAQRRKPLPDPLQIPHLSLPPVPPRLDLIQKGVARSPCASPTGSPKVSLIEPLFLYIQILRNCIWLFSRCACFFVLEGRLLWNFLCVFSFSGVSSAQKKKKIPCILDPDWLCLLSPLVDFGKCLSLCIIPCIVRCLQLHVLVICDLCLSDDYIAFGYGQNFKDIAVIDQFCNKPWFMKINRNGSFLKIDFWGHYLI